MAERQLSIRLAAVGGDQVRRELRAVGDDGSRALTRIADAAWAPSASLRALNGVGGELRLGLQGLAGQAGTLGSAMMALGPRGLAVGAALGGVIALVKKSVDAFAAHEQVYKRLEGVLRATGYASGLTAKELDSFATSLDKATLAAKNEVLAAASVLATFRSVSGETFKRTLTLAQDMAAVFGGDLKSSATRLGKALEDPVNGVTALREVGVSFTQSQRDLITSLTETGQAAEAQRVILDTVQQQIGGAAVGETGGFKGAVDGLSLAWTEMLVRIGETSSIVGPVLVVLNGLAALMDHVREKLEDSPLAQAATIQSQLLLAQRSLAEAQASGAALRWFDDFSGSTDRLEQHIKELEDRLATVRA